MQFRPWKGSKTMNKKWITEYAQIIIGASLVALSYNLFLLPAKLAAGGISGVSTILFELYALSPALTQFLINLPIFIIGWIALGSDFSWKRWLVHFGSRSSFT